MPSPKTAALAGGIALALLAGGSAVAYATTTQPLAATQASSTVLASEDLAGQLVFNLEEERMARDLYALFAQTYDNARPFSMITRSEQQHVTAVTRLLQTYGVADPSAGKNAGEYAVPAIQQLYDTWKAQGLTSLQEAYNVGVALEQRDIADLEAAVATVSQQDVKDVFTRLLAASRNHLAAFTNAAAGTTTPGTGNGMQRGAGMGNGAGMGYGMGYGAGTDDAAPRDGVGHLGPNATHDPGDCPLAAS